MMNYKNTSTTLSWLRARSEQAVDSGADLSRADAVFSLQLAESAAAKCELDSHTPEHPLQLVVFGPTQSGKSTVVNLLLQAQAAGVSPLAGYTMHAQGFHVGHSGGDWLREFFPDYQHVAVSELPRDDADCYSAEAVDSPLQPAPSTVWDSPDFDSLRAGDYRESVVRALGLADAALLVVSKDKYADQAVWEVLDLVRALGRPLMICVNKVADGDRELVVNSLLARLEEYWGNAAKPAVVVLPWQPGLGESEQVPIDVTALRKSVSDSLSRATRESHPQQLQSLVDHCWPQWRAPLLAEVNAATQWHSLVDARGAAVLKQYKRDYLEHPQQDETFQRSLIELLQLLEIPAVAGVLGKTRQLITWPARQLLGMAGLADRAPADPDDSLERRLLLDLYQQSLTSLSETALDRAAEGGEAGAWWRGVASGLRQQRERLSGEFDQRILNYQRDFEPEIEAAAQKLYEGLQEQPVVLNSLRAARFGADAAGVALAVKSGGLGLIDLALAPAMLSVTSLLTEGAMGKYIDSVMRELRELQEERVQKLLLEDGLVAVLNALPTALTDQPGFYGLDEQQYQLLAETLGQDPSVKVSA
ncbi:MAG: GTPase [Granulosicoccaceae bacterium]